MTTGRAELSISNICWPDGQDDAAFSVLSDMQVTAIDIAPTKAFPQIKDAGFEAVTADDIATFRHHAAMHGLSVAGMQSLTYGRTENMFGSDREGRFNLKKYLKQVITLGETVGATTLIYGSGGTRTTGHLNEEQIEERAAEFFLSLDIAAANAGIELGIEPVSTVWTKGEPVFGRTGGEVTDFVTRMKLGYGATALRFVPDTFAMHDAGENADKVIMQAVASRVLAHHMQISEVGMAPPTTETPINHEPFDSALRWIAGLSERRAPVIAVEMFPVEGSTEETRARLLNVIETAHSLYPHSLARRS